MSDFKDVKKHLDIVPTRVATSDEASNAVLPFDKYYSLRKVRDIKKIHYTLTIPAYIIPSALGFRRLMFQYNIIAPSPFYILNAGEDSIFWNISGSIATIKWRVGADVFRYNISLSDTRKNLFPTLLFSFPFYNNQLVPQNCVLEFWRINISSFSGNIGLDNPIKIKTSLLTNPMTPDELEVDKPQTVKTFSDISYSLPQAVPITNSGQTTTVWLNN